MGGGRWVRGRRGLVRYSKACVISRGWALSLIFMWHLFVRVNYGQSI